MALQALLLLVSVLFLASHIFLANGGTVRRNGKRLRFEEPFLYWQTNSQQADPFRTPPDTLPFVGNGLRFLQDRHVLFSWFVKCEKLFGFETFAISVPSLPPGVVINDPKNLEFVLKHEDIFGKGDFFKQRSWDLFGNGIINVDGELWKMQRKAGLAFLSTSNLKVLIEVALPKYLKDTMQTLQAASATNNQNLVDLEIVFHELTTQLMGRMAYNMDMHANDLFSKSFEYASGATGERFQNPLWQLTELFLGKKFRKALSEVRSYGQKIVANAVESRTAKEAPGTSGIEAISGSLISSLLDAIGDHKMVADAALNYLSAGRDTTAQALTWTFYLLMRHPEVTARLREEADSQPLQMSYTMAVFYEALRLYPPVPFEIKQCEQAATLPDGTELPRYSVVVWCTWAMNRSKLIWEDGEVFRPERWLSEDGALVGRSAYEYPVFNGGTRTCLGKKMAESIAVKVISDLVRVFDFVALDDLPRISKNSLTLPMQGGLPCHVRQRD